MGYRDDSSPHIDRWTNAKLFRELKRLLSMESARFNLPEGYSPAPYHNGDDTAAIAEATRVWRQSWVDPIVEELEKRAVK